MSAPKKTVRVPIRDIQEVGFCDAENVIPFLSAELYYRYVVHEGCEACKKAAEEARENRLGAFLFGGGA